MRVSAASSSSRVFRPFFWGRKPSNRLVEDHRARLGGEFLQSRLPSFLLGEEALEHESVAGQAARHQGGYEGRRSWQALHLYPSLHRLTDKEEARIADARRAGIADQSHVLTSQQTADDGGAGTVFVELMM